MLSRLASEGDIRVEILIPRSLAERLGRRVSNSEFRSISDYASFVLGQVIAKLEADASSGRKGRSVG